MCKNRVKTRLWRRRSQGLFKGTIDVMDSVLRLLRLRQSRNQHTRQARESGNVDAAKSIPAQKGKMRAAVDRNERSQTLGRKNGSAAATRYIANNEGLRFVTQCRMRCR